MKQVQYKFMNQKISITQPFLSTPFSLLYWLALQKAIEYFLIYFKSVSCKIGLCCFLLQTHCFFIAKAIAFSLLIFILIMKKMGIKKGGLSPPLYTFYITLSTLLKGLRNYRAPQQFRLLYQKSVLASAYRVPSLFRL